MEQQPAQYATVVTRSIPSGTLVPASRPHHAKLIGLLRQARSIYVSACAAEITAVPELLREAAPRNAVVTGLFSTLVNKTSYADAELGLRVRTFMLTRELKRDLARGLVDYCPWRYSMIDRWLSAPNRFDVALVMLSPPDARGNHSLGVQTDFFPSFWQNVRHVIGFVNPHMPRTAGDGQIHHSSLSAVFDCDQPLLTMEMKAADDVTVRIARAIAELIPDGATVQVGVGQIPSQVIAQLRGHRRLRIHTGVIDDYILGLFDSAAIDPAYPVETGTAVGKPDLYAAVGDRERFRFRAVSYTHSGAVIASLPRFHAVNSVLCADLLGQISAEASSGRLIASPGGLVDFSRGALANPTGRSIVAVRARSIGAFGPGIVPLLEAPHLVTSPALDADIIVTEFGTAHLRDLPLDERAEAMIAIAAPEDQQHLTDAWAHIRQGLFHKA